MSRTDSTRLATIGVVLLVMVAAVIGQTPAPQPPGIYVEMPGKTGDGALVKLHSVIVQEVKQKGMFKLMATGGLAKSAVMGAIDGTSASVRVPAAGDVAFYFYFDPKAGRASTPTTPEEAMQMMSGDVMPMGARSPDDFVLLHLTPKDGGRQAQIGSVGGLGGGASGKSKDAVPCQVENLGPGAYRVRPKASLAPGEYAFSFAPQGPGGMLWDFGIDGR